MDDHDIKEYFKNTFNTVAQGYDNSALRFFPESGARLPVYLGLEGGEHVLDVATGTGATALALAAALPRGTVTGIDFSAGMLERAGTKIADLGVGNVQLHEMDMQEITFPDRHFDAATCSFALFFVEEMQEQLRHITTKVKRGGKVAITSFSENSFSPLVEIFFACLERYGVTPPTMTWKRVATPEKCIDLFTGAGLQNINVDQVDRGSSLKSPEEWWQIVWNGGFRGLVQQLPENEQQRFKAEHLAEIARQAAPDGTRMELGVIYTTGTA